MAVAILKTTQDFKQDILVIVLPVLSSFLNERLMAQTQTYTGSLVSHDADILFRPFA